MKSPCNQTCRIHHRTGYCEGCGRDLDEIQEWPTASVGRRQQILSALPSRMAEMAEAVDSQACQAAARSREPSKALP
ncbi:DUF1289 domain-containing protein [Blastomonas sp. AAP53]|uniref:DUF1289 domain-containing protein n=1 Tax=Blastomonas sp. AAP53 TaxID=1248760 RepID=UPI0002F9398A|nr:DUF1289 domain-containing protein [Blastomonas sp. AAP53]